MSSPRSQAAAADRRLVLVTLDGMRWQDVFRGADPVIAAILARFPGAEIVDVQFGDAPEVTKAENEPVFEDTGDWTAGWADPGPDELDD